MTIKFAAWPGRCPLCKSGYERGARIMRSPDGWGHERCVAAWRERRNKALVASAGR